MLFKKARKLLILLMICLVALPPSGTGLNSNSVAATSSQFYSYNDMVKDLESIAKQYPELIKMTVAGKSVENKNIYQVKLGKGSRNVVITGSVHGSEWITTPALIETIETYAKYYQQDKWVNGQPMRYILDNYTLVILPMVNPDGVTLVQQGANAFPHRRDELLAINDGTNFRGWKANIRGVDLNRNFNARWGEPATGSVNHEPAHAFYGGTGPESEPETKVVTNTVRNSKPVLLLDYHSYGELLYWYYLQTGSTLERDQRIVQAIRNYNGYRLESINPNTLPGATMTFWGSRVVEIPSITVEVSNRPPRTHTMADYPRVISRVKYLPIVAITNLPGYVRLVPVTSVSLPETVGIELGTTQKIQASIRPANASNKKITWSSSDPETISVDANGQITAHDLGTAVITVTTQDGNKTATSMVTSFLPLSHISSADNSKYKTAVEVSKTYWKQADAVVITDSELDYTYSVPLARQLAAPVLSSRANLLNVHTKHEIKRLGAKQVYILGDFEAVSKDIDQQLAEMGLEIVRIIDPGKFKPAATLFRRDPSGSINIIQGKTLPAAVAANYNFPLLPNAGMSQATNTAGLGKLMNLIIYAGNSVNWTDPNQ